jgi:hypothetical protein
MKKNLIISVFLLMCAAFLMGCSSKETLTEEKVAEGTAKEEKAEISKVEVKKAEQVPEFTEGLAANLLIEFEDVFYSPLEGYNGGPISQFNTKEELSKEFEGIATQPLIKTFVDTYFIEKDGALYPQETDGPLLFESDTGFEIDKNAHTLTQRITSDMDGTVDMEFSFSLHNNKWLFSGLESQQIIQEEIVEQPVQEEKLTESQALAMVGQALRIASIETYEVGDGEDYFIIKAYDKETNKESFYKVDAYDKSVEQVER